MTPKIFGGKTRVLGRGEMRALLPPMCRILEPPAGSDSYELRLGRNIFEQHRYAFGYIGSIKRLPQGSANTSTSFVCNVVIKIAREGDSVPYSEYRCCFARVLAYTADYPDTFLGPESIVSVRDFAQGTIAAPHSKTHAWTNFNFRRFAYFTE